MDTISEKLVIIASNEQKVYDSGKTAGTIIGGYVDGYNSGTEDGKLAERQDFWNKFTKNQTRNDYSYGFYAWYGDAFRPTCDIGGSNMGRAFYYFGGMSQTTDNVDLIQICKDCGIKIDFSKATSISYCFGNAYNVVTIPVVDLSKLTVNSAEGFVNNCRKLTTIEKMIVTEKTTFTLNTFGASALEEIRFEGVIAKDISFQYCALLSDESVASIIDHLKDLTGATTQTLTFHADVGARLTEEQKTAIAAKNWTLAY